MQVFEKSQDSKGQTNIFKSLCPHLFFCLSDIERVGECLFYRLDGGMSYKSSGVMIIKELRQRTNPPLYLTAL